LYDPEDREMDPDVVRVPEDLTVGAGAYCRTLPVLRREDVPVLRFLMVEG
jgi:hypothetical protein